MGYIQIMICLKVLELDAQIFLRNEKKLKEKLNVMNETIYIVGALVMYFLGIATGIYFSSQIEKDINKRIKK
tara:strand:- start:917 stop:1132 length:216 start_codon:yes stop_codon:yes gene_type:complete